MNSKENALAQAILDEMMNCARIQPEKARELSEAYKNLCAAYEIRVRAEKEDKR